jgi:lipopolysaccharide transport system ATP-binding protein
MSGDDIAIKVSDLSKCYQIYGQPHDRLKQSIYPRLQRLAGKQPKQYFREFWAIKDVSFEIKKGETVGIIGRNGSGKSTLLQMICGTLNPTSGSIQTHGRIAALLELGSGFNPEFTGRENVYMNAAVLGLSREETDARFDDIAAFADIGDFIEQPVKTYSSGMAVRLAFAVAINVDPQILVVDEALSVGDELFQRKCFSRIDAIKKNGATILFVSHAGGTIVELCDHAILMDAGDILAMGPPKIIVGYYQKLLYAPKEKQREICHFIQTTVLDELPQECIAIPAEVSSDSSLIKSKEDDGNVEFFDPNLKSSTTLFYESHGADISLPEIFTLAGEKVNWLRSGETYHYVYTVKFEEDSFDVRFGMMIKGINGIEIGGIGSASSGHGIGHVSAGKIINVRFTFQCHLLPGHYFANAGCSGKVNGEDVFLHRVVDAATFRVLPISHRELRAGYINFAAKESYFLAEYKK